MELRTDEGVQVGRCGDLSSKLRPGALKHLKHEVRLQVGAQVRHLVAQALQVLQHSQHSASACGPAHTPSSSPLQTPSTRLSTGDAVEWTL